MKFRLSSRFTGIALPLLILVAFVLAGCEAARVEGEPAVVADLAEPVLTPAPESRVAGARPAPGPRAGVLTAGDIDDTLNLGRFVTYQRKASQMLNLPRANLSRPVSLRLVGANGAPASGARVTLSKPGGRTFFDGYAGVDGVVTVFPAVLGAGTPRQVELRVLARTQDEPFAQTVSTGTTMQTVRLPSTHTWEPDFLDLAFVIDTTGSMADELDWITKDLGRIVRRARAGRQGLSIRYGLVVYRDKGDAYVVRNFGFTKSLAEMQSWLRAQKASGGGDYPEAAAAALAAGAKLNWRRGQGERLMFHIADAPPHRHDARRYLAAAAAAAKKNVQIFGLGASGVAAESEFLMRQAAVQTGGRYLFLTDDSGVGYAHAEPTISCYRVTRLSNLMVRILRSELFGKRVEAPDSSVIRRVGSYARGVCRN